MYGLFGISHNIQSIYKLSASYRKERSIKTAEDLKPCYLDFIDQHYGNPPLNRSNDLVVSNLALAKELLNFFAFSRINDLNQESMVGNFYDQRIQESNAEIATMSLKALRELNFEFSELFRLAIHSVVISSSSSNKAGFKAHGGSTSKLIGLIWLTLKPGLSAQDLYELYVHETTHTLVFIDELNYGHFNYNNITSKDFWAKSSILSRTRPMDKVVHSIIVATEVLHARSTYLPNKETLTVHTDTKTMKMNALASIQSVLNLPNVESVCLPRSIELVEKSRTHILNL